MAVFIFCFTLTYCFSVPVFATSPGIVEAETIWNGWQTIAFMLGFSNDFNDQLSTSKNNDLQYEYYYNKIMNDNSLSSAEKDTLIYQLDQARLSLSDKIILIGEDLWSFLLRFTYEDKIKSVPNLAGNLSTDSRAYFDAYEGTCAIYSVVGDFGAGRTTIAIFGNGCMANPLDQGYN